MGSGHLFPGKPFPSTLKDFCSKEIIDSCHVTIFHSCNINDGYSWIYSLFELICIGKSSFVSFFSSSPLVNYQQSFPTKRSLLPSTVKRAVPRCSLRFTSPSPGEPAPKTRRKFRARHPPGKPRFLQPDFRAGGMTDSSVEAQLF